MLGPSQKFFKTPANDIIISRTLCPEKMVLATLGVHGKIVFFKLLFNSINNVINRSCPLNTFSSMI